LKPRGPFLRLNKIFLYKGKQRESEKSLPSGPSIRKVERGGGDSPGKIDRKKGPGVNVGTKTGKKGKKADETQRGKAGLPPRTSSIKRTTKQDGPKPHKVR